MLCGIISESWLVCFSYLSSHLLTQGPAILVVTNGVLFFQAVPSTSPVIDRWTSFMSLARMFRIAHYFGCVWNAYTIS
ncbi:hypothetical protein DPMN_169926 [Dreissena polymorpha]|uniref:Uncharacterized protein n=1 Tax=Dreissena polymorpha TaxID=45954 RepID=A0A9D4ICQ3_DREPO|nr:hypothetical protein DPMN_169926 [Dreissena polymorpha]